jgi:hypothetical protein
MQRAIATEERTTPKQDDPNLWDAVEERKL